MKSIKKFSAISVKDQSITESAKVTKEAVDELIKKIGFNSIDELKKEKDLLSKLEAMSKAFVKGSQKVMIYLRMKSKKIEPKILKMK